MANTTIIVEMPSGVSGPVVKLADPATPDTIVNGAGGDTLTEQTNMKGWYTATVTEALAGLHIATIETSSGDAIGTGRVVLQDDTGTYFVRDEADTAIKVWNAIISSHQEVQSFGNAFALTGGSSYVLASLNRILGVAFAEATQGRHAANFSTFFNNADVATAKKVDDVGGGGDATASNQSTIIAAIGAVDAIVDKLDTAMEADGLVYRFTSNALEQAPTGGGSGPGSSEVTLTVDNGSGVPVADCEVWLQATLTGPSVWSGTTNSNGEAVALLNDGATYYLFASKDGFEHLVGYEFTASAD